MSTQLTNKGLECEAVVKSEEPTGASGKVLLYASGSGSDTRLYVKAGSDDQKLLGIDIDSLDALGSATVAQVDHVLVSDAGTEKKVTFSNFEDSLFGNVSGQAAIAGGGALSLDVAAITGQTAMTGDVADADELMISDGGVLKRVDFSVLRDAVFTDVSGDATIAAGGAITIAANSVALATDTTGDYVQNLTAGTGLTSTGATSGENIGHSLSVDASQTQITGVGTLTAGVWNATAIATAYIADDAVTGAKIALFDDSLAATTTHFLIADGTDYSSFALSGDVTCTNGGVVTIGAGAVENSMLADDAVGADELAANAVVNASIASGAAIDMDKLDGDSLATAITDFAQDDLVILSDTSDSGNLVKITASNFEDAIFGNVSGDATVAAAGALTIAADAVTYAKMQNVTATNLILGRDSAGAGIVEEIAPAALRTMINVEDGSTADQTAVEIIGLLNADLGGAFTIGNQSDDAATFSGDLVVHGGLTVRGTTTVVDSATIQVSSSFTFEGATADAHETLFSATDATADTEIKLPALAAGTYFVPLLADTATAASSLVTAAEFALLDGANARGTSALASGDGFLHNDGGTMKMTSIDKIGDYLGGGVGLAVASGIIGFNPNGLTAAVVDVASDSIAIVDADGSNLPKKESIADLVTAMAGNGLGAASGVLAVGVDGSSVELSGDAVRVKARGVATSMLALDAVTADILASDAVVNASVASSAAIAFSKLAALADGNVLLGNASNVAASVALSGDATVARSGAVTLTATNTNLTTLANVVTVGALDAGSITSGFGGIDIGASALACGTLDLSDGVITNVGDIDCDSISVADAANGLNIDFSAAATGTGKITVADGLAGAYQMMSGAVALESLSTAMTPMPVMTRQYSTNYTGSSALIGNIGFAVDRRLAIGSDSNGMNPAAHIKADSTNSNRLTIQSTSSLRQVGAHGSLDNFSEAITNAGAVFWTTPAFAITNSGADVPHLEMINTNADANPSAFIMTKTSASPADNDEIAELLFRGNNDAAEQEIFASMKALASDVSNGSEDGKLEWMIRADAAAVTMTFDASGLTLADSSAHGKVTAHSFVTYSDESLKTNITPMGSALSTVKKLQGVTYDWKNDGKNDIGFIAQEVAKVVPEVVTKTGNAGLFAMDYARLTAVLVEGMKEQQKQIEDLKNVVVKLSNGKVVNAKMVTVKVPASTELLSGATSDDGEKLLADKYGWSDED